eukprot:COSAG05_NODE_185_length_14731_cov_30.866389_1_plen_243_part_00
MAAASLLVSAVAVAAAAARSNRLRSERTAPYRHMLEAVVMRRGELVPLPLPLYVTDTYLGGWNQFDLTIHPDLDLATEIYYAPDPSVSSNYSTAAFGERAFVRQRLELMQRSGLTPALHIMPHRLIYRNASSGTFELMEWNDEGARVGGQFLNSVALFQVKSAVKWSGCRLCRFIPVIASLKLRAVGCCPVTLPADTRGAEAAVHIDLRHVSFVRFHPSRTRIDHVQTTVLVRLQQPVLCLF